MLHFFYFFKIILILNKFKFIDLKSYFFIELKNHSLYCARYINYYFINDTALSISIKSSIYSDTKSIELGKFLFYIFPIAFLNI